MDQEKIKEKIEQILSKPSYKFHSFNEEKMYIYTDIEPTPSTQYYHQREILDIMNDLFDEEIPHHLDQEKNQIVIEC
jgi:hypothetical protein